MKRLREGKYEQDEQQNTSKKDLNVRDMLKITRNFKMNEDVVPGNATAEDNVPAENKETAYDQTEEEEKFRNYFDDMNVDIKFIPLQIFQNLIYWGGTIDGVIQFKYKVTPDEKSKKIELNYLPDFTADNPDNDLIVKKIESYFDIFYKYWRNNILNSSSPETQQ